MATVDELVVKITLDTDDLKKGTKETKKGLESTGKIAGKQAGDISASGKKAAGFYKEMRNEVLGLFAVYKTVSSGINLALDRIDSKGNLSRLSNNLGESISDLNAWGKAVEVVGGRHEDFESTVSGMSQALQEMQRTGDPGKFVALQQFGVMLDFWDKSGAPKKGTELLLQLSDAFKKMADEGKQAQAFNLGKSIGIDEGTINLMMRGSDAMMAMVNNQRLQNNVNSENAKSLEAVQEAKNKFVKSTENLVDNIMIRELPAIQSAVNWFGELGESVKENTGILGGFLTMAEGLPKILGVMKDTALSFDTEKNKSAYESLIPVVAPIAESILTTLFPNGGYEAISENFGTSGKKLGSSANTKKITDNYGSLIQKYADKYNVDPNLIASMIASESSGNPNAVSNKGAGGLMQLMPDTAKEFGVNNVFDPEQNIAGGTKKIAGLLKKYGNTNDALIAYNEGEGNFAKGTRFKESTDYANKIILEMNQFKQNNQSPTKSVETPIKSATSPTKSVETPKIDIGIDRMMKEHDAYRAQNLSDYLASKPSTNINIGDVVINNPQTNDPNKFGDMVSDKIKWNMTNQFESGTR